MEIEQMKLMRAILLILIVLVPCGCLRYLTHDRGEVLLDGVDIDQTLKIAKINLDKYSTTSILGVWVIRDQYVTPSQAARISDLYFSHIDSLKQQFSIWHFTWAIADLYRNGDENTRNVLQTAYDDAKLRVKKLGGRYGKFVEGDKMYMGDAHFLGRMYAERHVVVPGNPKYLQSYDEYAQKKGLKTEQ